MIKIDMTLIIMIHLTQLIAVIKNYKNSKF